MNKRPPQAWFQLGSVSFLCCLLMLTILADGCAPLRKKFTRKKKKESAESQTIPVLEPVDYPKKVYSSAETYRHHYSLWQVWHQELQNIILENGYRKRKVYFIDQAIIHLEAMGHLIIEEKQTSLLRSLEALRMVKADLESPVPRRNLSALKRELSSIDNDLRKEYKFSHMKDALKP